MKSWEVGDEVSENGGDSRDKLSVYEANARDPHNAEIGAQAEEPVKGNLVLNIKLVFLERAVVPSVHN